MDRLNISQLANSFPIGNMFLLVVLSLLPLIFLASTSYLKVSVVLSLLRSALGGGQVPSQAISGVLALLISLYTISPVLEQIVGRFEEYAETNKNKKAEDSQFLAKIKYASEPLLAFIKENVQQRERIYFYKLEQQRKYQFSRKEGQMPPQGPCQELDSSSFKQCLSDNETPQSLLLSFVVGELRVACMLGVYIFIPFLIIDLVISTLLTGLGMMMVSPMTITLPIKLLVFVVGDGWRLLVENLILSYKLPTL